MSLSVENLTSGYRGRRVIAGLTLPPLAAGEVTVLAGPNAAGKSTLLQTLAGLIRAGGGRAVLEGADLLAMPAVARAGLVGFMPQTPPAAAGLSVLESVIAARAVTLRAGAEAAAIAVLTRLGLVDLADRSMARLSGGQRQMVALAQAMVRQPRLLLLDEPTSALDLARQVRLLGTLRALAAEGRIVVAVLHDLGLAARWADRIAVLDDGRLAAFGTPSEVLTPDLLARTWGIRARVERCSAGHLLVLSDGEVAVE